MALRAVLDANVMVSAFIRPQGPSGEILRRFVEARAFELVLSPPILGELRRALSYPRVRKHLSETDEQLDLRVASLGILADLVEGGRDVRAVAADPDDDKYLAAALEGRAGFVVSGDHHLLDLRSYEGVRIVKPRQFLEVLDALPPGNPSGS